MKPEQKELARVTNLLCKVCEELYTDQNETFEDTCTAISDVEGLKEWWLAYRNSETRRLHLWLQYQRQRRIKRSLTLKQTKT